MSTRGTIHDGSQEAAILAMLQSGREVTPLVALNEVGCLRLASRILSLRQAGYAIDTRMERRGRKAWAAYRLAQ